MMEPTFFATPLAFRKWLEAHHDDAQELIVGFYKKGSGIPSITWPEAVDEALCFGWIDGVRKSIDDVSYTNRFTPPEAGEQLERHKHRKVEELTKAGRMHEAGLKAFEARDEEKSRIYSYEQRHAAELPEAYEQQFRENQRAWTFFEGQAPSYRKAAVGWVVSAKQEATRLRRLARLIDDSEHIRKIPPLTPRVANRETNA